MNRMCNDTSKTGFINQQFHTLTEHHRNIPNHKFYNQKHQIFWMKETYTVHTCNKVDFFPPKSSSEKLGATLQPHKKLNKHAVSVIFLKTEDWEGELSHIWANTLIHSLTLSENHWLKIKDDKQTDNTAAMLCRLHILRSNYLITNVHSSMYRKP